jgi:glycosylphosphatidylinositol transamidase (GPIT) subunit GPI8
MVMVGRHDMGVTSWVQHHADSAVGVSVIDRFTHATLDALERLNSSSRLRLADMVCPALGVRRCVGPAC